MEDYSLANASMLNVDMHHVKKPIKWRKHAIKTIGDVDSEKKVLWFIPNLQWRLKMCQTLYPAKQKQIILRSILQKIYAWKY